MAYSESLPLFVAKHILNNFTILYHLFGGMNDIQCTQIVHQVGMWLYDLFVYLTSSQCSF